MTCLLWSPKSQHHFAVFQYGKPLSPLLFRTLEMGLTYFVTNQWLFLGKGILAHLLQICQRALMAPDTMELEFFCLSRSTKDLSDLGGLIWCHTAGPLYGEDGLLCCSRDGERCYGRKGPNSVVLTGKSFQIQQIGAVCLINWQRNSFLSLSSVTCFSRDTRSPLGSWRC